MVANLFDAYTAALFLRSKHGESYRLVAKESLGDAVKDSCVIESGQGLIGWVAREGKRLHVTHFTRDTRTLGIYKIDTGIKAFLASPLPYREGVLMVDSKNRYAFPEKKQRILDDCARVAYDLWFLIRQEVEREFYRKLLDWLIDSGANFLDDIGRLGKLLGLKMVLYACKDRGEKLYRLRGTIGVHGLKAGDTLYSVDEGLMGWFFRYKKNVILNKFRGEAAQSFIIKRNESLNPGPVVVGICLPENGETSEVVLFSGETDIERWPSDILETLSRSLSRIRGNT